MLKKIVPFKITLSWADMEWAGHIAISRDVSSQEQGHHHTYGGENKEAQEKLFDSVVGARGELAAARFLQVPWPAGINTFHEPDIPPRWQVRTGKNFDDRCIIRGNDIASHLFLLVTGVGPEFTIRGWIEGYEGKEIGEYGTPDKKRPECWWVRQVQLHPFFLGEDGKPTTVA